MENIDKIENIEDILKYFSGDSMGEIENIEDILKYFSVDTIGEIGIYPMSSMENIKIDKLLRIVWAK